MFDSSYKPHRFFSRTLMAFWAAAALSACGKEEPVSEGTETAPATSEVTQESEPKGAVLGMEGTPESDPLEEALDATQPEAEQSDSLRNRITTSPAPESAKPTWSQATTPEERRANLEEALAVESGPYAIDMHDLGGWELDEREENPIPDYILALDGKEFIMRGFMMPDIDFEHIRSFHLVRSLFSCCFGAPPQINEIMRITLADEDGMDYTYNTIEVRGRLTVTFEIVDGLVEDIFRLENVTYRILEFDDPDAPESFDANTGFDSVIPSGPQEY